MEAFDFFFRVFLSPCTSFRLNWNVIPQKVGEEIKLSKSDVCFEVSVLYKFIDCSVYFCLCMAALDSS